MVDEVYITVLIGRMEAARDRGFRVTSAMATLLIAALRFYAKERGWRSVPPADQVQPPVPRPQPYRGPLATIGNAKSEGIKSFHVICRAHQCGQDRLFTFDELNLPDDQIFIHIPRVRRFRYSKCGSLDVRVFPNTLEHWAPGMGRDPPLGYKPRFPLSTAMNPDRTGE